MYRAGKKNYTVSMKNAEASVRMEGYRVTSEMKTQCERVLRCETTTAEVLKRFSESVGRT